MCFFETTSRSTVISGPVLIKTGLCGFGGKYPAANDYCGGAYFGEHWWVPIISTTSLEYGRSFVDPLVNASGSTGQKSYFKTRLGGYYVLKLRKPSFLTSGSAVGGCSGPRF